MDNLEKLLSVQRQSQEERGYTLPADHVGDTVNYLHWNVTALQCELVELLDETSWKPWTIGPAYVNRDAALGEAIDALHFLNNIFLELGASADEIVFRYLEKSAINRERFRSSKYDGVSTKCPVCKRALDDPYVLCSELVGCTKNIADVGEAVPWPATT